MRSPSQSVAVLYLKQYNTNIDYNKIILINISNTLGMLGKFHDYLKVKESPKVWSFLNGNCILMKVGSCLCFDLGNQHGRAYGWSRVGHHRLGPAKTMLVFTTTTI